MSALKGDFLSVCDFRLWFLMHSWFLDHALDCTGSTQALSWLDKAGYGRLDQTDSKALPLRELKISYNPRMKSSTMDFPVSSDLITRMNLPDDGRICIYNIVAHPWKSDRMVYVTRRDGGMSESLVCLLAFKLNSNRQFNLPPGLGVETYPAISTASSSLQNRSIERNLCRIITTGVLIFCMRLKIRWNAARYPYVSALSSSVLGCSNHLRLQHHEFTFDTIWLRDYPIIGLQLGIVWWL